MKTTTIFLLVIGFIINIYAQDESIYFDSDQYDIRFNENSKLANIGKQYFEGIYKILLVGHCDVAGSDSYNMELSKKRANSVKEYFIKKNILEEDIQIDFQGETKADQVAQMYRKVEIFLIPKLKPIIEEVIPDVPLLSDEKIIDIFTK